MTTPRRDTSSSHQPPSADAGAKVLLAGDPAQLAAVDAGGAFGPISDEPHRLVTLAGYPPARPVIDATTQALQYSAGRDLFSRHDSIGRRGHAYTRHEAAPENPPLRISTQLGGGNELSFAKELGLVARPVVRITIWIRRGSTGAPASALSVMARWRFRFAPRGSQGAAVRGPPPTHPAPCGNGSGSGD